jgi:ribose transport system substrate-binding protein
MFKKITKLVSCILLVTMLLSACQNAPTAVPTTEAAADAPTEVAADAPTEAAADAPTEAAPAAAGGPDTTGLSLAGKTIGIEVIGTDHAWDRLAWQGAQDMVEQLGGTIVATSAGRNDQQHVADLENLMAQKPDAIVNVLGTYSVIEPVFKKIQEAGIPLFAADTASPYVTNNVTSDNFLIGTSLAIKMAEDMGGKGNIAVFNGFYGIGVCAIRYDGLQYVLKYYPEIKIIQPELQDAIPNTQEDARKKIQDLLSKYPKGEVSAIWSCWDIPSFGANEAVVEAGRVDDVKIYGVDGDATVLEVMANGGSALAGDAAQQPYLIGQTVAINIAKYFAGQEVPVPTYVQPFLATPENVDEVRKMLGQIE